MGLKYTVLQYYRDRGIQLFSSNEIELYSQGGVINAR